MLLTIDYYKRHGTIENVPRNARPRKTSPREDKLIVRIAKKDRLKAPTRLKIKVFSPDDPRNVLSRLVRRRLVESKLFGRVS
jgi:hypothetical protein